MYMADVIAFFDAGWFRCTRNWLCGLRNDAAGTQAGDFSRAETELFENLFVVLAEIRRAFRWHFADTMHLNRTADRRAQLAACSLDRHDDVIQSQLWIGDDFLLPTHSAVRDVNAIEDFVPMRHRL